MRPALRLFAGRDKFSQTRFARQFREVFADAFGRRRADLASGKGRRGWLDWSLSGLSPFDLVGGLVANLVLAVALSVRRRVAGTIDWPGVLKAKAPDA